MSQAQQQETIAPARKPRVRAVPKPRASPEILIGRSRQGWDVYEAPPVPRGRRRPLAVLITGTPVWPLPEALVGFRAEEPFGVLDDGTQIWLTPETPAAVAAPRRRRWPLRR